MGQVLETAAMTVTHCNSRTGYEIVAHRFAPEACAECLRIEALLTGQPEPEAVPR